MAQKRKSQGGDSLGSGNNLVTGVPNIRGVMGAGWKIQPHHLESAAKKAKFAAVTRRKISVSLPKVESI